MVSRVCRLSIASPALPNLRPRPPLRSRNPRCNRAGTVTVTRAGRAEELTSNRRSGFFMRRVFWIGIEVYTASRDPGWQSRGKAMADNKERTYSDDEIATRLKND